MARKILLRSPRWQEKFATNCLILRKKDQKNFKLKAIENPKLTQNYKIQDTFQPLEKHQKQLNYFFNIAKIKSNI